MSTIALYPPPPPTHNSLTRAQRTQLQRSASKLERVLGAAPHVLDLHYQQQPQKQQPPPPQPCSWSSDNLSIRWDTNVVKPQTLEVPAQPPRTAHKIPRKRPPLYPIDPSAAPPSPVREPSYYLTDLITAYSAPSPLSEHPPSPSSSTTPSGSSPLSYSPSLRSATSTSSLASLCPKSGDWTFNSNSSLPLPPPPSERKLVKQVLRSLTRSSTIQAAPAPRPSSPLLTLDLDQKRPTLTTPVAAGFSSPGGLNRLEGDDEPEEDVFPLGCDGAAEPPAFRIASDGALRRAKMERLRRRLGECVPVALVFPAHAQEAIVEEDEESDEEDGATTSDESFEIVTPVDVEEANKHLASVRTPFLWRKKLDVIHEHD